jgi:hypothetical protein
MLAETYNGPTGYGVYGSDAFQLSQQLLDSANDQFGQLASVTEDWAIGTGICLG